MDVERKSIKYWVNVLEELKHRDLSFKAYLNDCKEYLDSDKDETYTTYYDKAKYVFEDYELWKNSPDEWLKEAS